VAEAKGEVGCAGAISLAICRARLHERRGKGYALEWITRAREDVSWGHSVGRIWLVWLCIWGDCCLWILSVLWLLLSGRSLLSRPVHVFGEKREALILYLFVYLLEINSL
jgi:hypothetical protein